MLEALLLRMSEGTYSPGSPLPPQRELAAELNVSRDTVQRVLRELVDRGLVESRQGSGSRVIGSPPPPSAGGRVRHTGRTTLRPHIDRAFEQSAVRLDVFTFTSESLAAHIWFQAERIRTRVIAPERIALRMLLPSQDLPLPYPRALAEPDDPRPMQRLHAITRRNTEALRITLEELRAEGLVADVDVQVRTVPITPAFKLYLFNGTEALHGMYEVVERPIVLEDETISAVDVVGLGAVLEHFVAEEDPDAPASVFVSSRQAWFDSVWRLLTVA